MARTKSTNGIVQSKKESILAYIEKLMGTIKKKNVAFTDKVTGVKYYYNNDVGYIDRQFENITQDDIKKNEMVSTIYKLPCSFIHFINSFSQN